MQGLYRYGMVVARLMVAIVFLLNATGVIDQAEAARELAERGAPSNLVPFLMIVARSVELIGGLALLFGIFPRLAALALFAFLIAATLIGHAFWLVTGTPAYVGQLMNFLKNLAMMGGLLFIASIEDQPVFRWSTQGKTGHDEVLSRTEKAHL
jgi:putative oxidoreductase